MYLESDVPPPGPLAPHLGVQLPDSSIQKHGPFPYITLAHQAACLQGYLQWHGLCRTGVGKDSSHMAL